MTMFTKPFQIEEVLARLRAIIRRAAGHAIAELVCGKVHLDTRSSRVTVDGTAIKLTAQEFRSYLARCIIAVKVVSRTELDRAYYL